MPQDQAKALDLGTCAECLCTQRGSDSIQKRLVSAVPDHLRDKFVELRIRGSPGCAKSVLVILNKQAAIVDVTMPFEGNEESSSTKAPAVHTTHKWVVSHTGIVTCAMTL